MIFTALSLLLLNVTAYFLYEEAISVRLFAKPIKEMFTSYYEIKVL